MYKKLKQIIEKKGIKCQRLAQWVILMNTNRDFRCLKSPKPTTTQRCHSETETFILEGLFSSVLSKFKKNQPSGNLKFNNLGNFQSLKLGNLMGKILPISLKLNFTPNALGCYGFRQEARTLNVKYSAQKAYISE